MAVRISAQNESLSRTANLPAITTFTVMGWFYFVDFPGSFPTVMANGPAVGSTYYQVYTTGAGQLRAWQGGTVNGSTLTTGTWYHIAMVVDGTGAGNFRVYLNGELDITNNGNAAISGGKLWLGNSNSDEWADLRVAGVKVFAAALTEAEIADEMGFGYAIRQDDVNSVNPLRDHTDLGDISGNGNDFTGAGTLSTEDDPPNVDWSQAQTVAFNAIAAATTVYQMGISSGGGATSEGPNDPGTSSTSGAVGAWTNVTNISDSDDFRASYSVSGTTSAGTWLVATGFGFDLPDGAADIGIVASFEGSVSDAARLAATVSLWSGGAIGTAKSSVAWPTSEGITTYGDSSDAWGATLSAAVVNSATFGVALRFTAANTNAYSASVDHVTLTVHYSGGTQTIVLSHLAAATSVHQMGVAPGAVAVALNHLGPTAAVAQMGISPGDVTVALLAIASATTVNQMGVSPGAVTLALAHLGPTGSVAQMAITGPPQTITLNHHGPTSSIYQMGIGAAGQVAFASLGPTTTVAQMGVAPGAVTVALTSLTGATSVFPQALDQGPVSVVFAQSGPFSTVSQMGIAAGAAAVVFDQFGPLAEVHQMTVAGERLVVFSAPTIATQVFQMFAGELGELPGRALLVDARPHYILDRVTTPYILVDGRPHYLLQRKAD